MADASDRVRQSRRWRYRVARQRRAIGRFADALERDLQAAEVEPSVRQALAVALDELLANVVMHAVAARGPVHVRLRRDEDGLSARLRYAAAPFDPTAQDAPTGPETLAEARIGGLGIAIVRSLCAEFLHEYRRGENRLRLRLLPMPGEPAHL